jgi:hypothetical protein
VHGKAEATAQLASEAVRAVRVRMRRAVGMARHADHQRVGTPLGHQLADRIERAGTGIDRAQRLGISGQRIAARHADPPRAEVESQIGRMRGDGRRKHHGGHQSAGRQRSPRLTRALPLG